MNIIVDKPPNYDLIVANFPSAAKKGVLFCWGSDIYNPTDIFVPESLIVHEEVHSKRQGQSPEWWWHNYLDSKIFRYAEELEAHKVEFKYVMEHLSRAERRAQAVTIAERLASPLYGNMVSVKKARKILEEYNGRQ